MNSFAEKRLERLIEGDADPYYIALCANNIFQSNGETSTLKWLNNRKITPPWGDQWDRKKLDFAITAIAPNGVVRRWTKGLDL